MQGLARKLLLVTLMRAQVKKVEAEEQREALEAIMAEGLHSGVHPLERPEVPPHIKVRSRAALALVGLVRWWARVQLRYSTMAHHDNGIARSMHLLCRRRCSASCWQLLRRRSGGWRWAAACT